MVEVLLENPAINVNESDSFLGLVVGRGNRLLLFTFCTFTHVVSYNCMGCLIHINIGCLQRQYIIMQITMTVWVLPMLSTFLSFLEPCISFPPYLPRHGSNHTIDCIQSEKEPVHHQIRQCTFPSQTVNVTHPITWLTGFQSKAKSQFKT